jgi:tetratricopeptide (TPR) repeat protein
MQKNIAVDEVLEKAIRFKIADEDYETAEKLCLDRISNGKRDAYYPRKWEYLLNDIYNASGDVDKQIKGTEMLFFAGKYDLYNTVKKLHIQKGDWEDVKDGIIAAAERDLPEAEYVKILNIEGDNKRILEMAKQNPFHIIKYGKKLIKDYPDEVIDLFRQAIDAQADFSKTRTHYRYLTKHIKALADCGQTELALQIIDELIEQYPRRTSMIDELDELRYRLQ